MQPRCKPQICNAPTDETLPLHTKEAAHPLQYDVGSNK